MKLRIQKLTELEADTAERQRLVEEMHAARLVMEAAANAAAEAKTKAEKDELMKKVDDWIRSMDPQAQIALIRAAGGESVLRMTFSDHAVNGEVADGWERTIGHLGAGL